jgi:hypothetical protein
MSIPDQFCPVISIGYKFIGNTLSQQSFHLFYVSIPDIIILSPDDHPSPNLSINSVPDDS